MAGIATAVNPRVVVEVTSPSTEEYDRGEKLDWYRQVPGLDGIVLVSHRERSVELVHRTADGWDRTQARAGERVEVRSIGYSIDVDELYRAVS